MMACDQRNRVLLLAVFCFGLAASASSPWTYECTNGVCNKEPLKEGESARGLNVCKLLCNPYAALWPRPSGDISFSQKHETIDCDRIAIKYSENVPEKTKELLNKLKEYATDAIEKNARDSPYVALSTSKKHEKSSEQRPLDIVINIADTSVFKPSLKVDEKYKLSVTTSPEPETAVVANIHAETYFGARHGVETLLQLLVWCDVGHNLVIPSEVKITDYPKYLHRGLLLDTARNYFSVDSIKRTIDGLAQVKMNVFHWHITDSHSFPFVATSRPELHTYGAYSANKIYTPENIRDIVEYARVRGVKVIPEFDAPAHVGEGWQFGDKDNMTVCFGKEPWTTYCVEPPCGQLNPLSEKMYDVLADIYRDMLDVFDSDVFHMGGDEVNLKCWNSSSELVDVLVENGYGRSESEFLRLWSDFQQHALDLLTKANKGEKIPAILWTSHLTEKGHVDQYLDSGNYIIQIWTTGKDSVIGELIRKGFRVILSNYDALYLDCGFGSWVAEGNNWCSPYIGWQKTYENRPHEILQRQNVEDGQDLVIGGEVALWSEQADEQVLDSRVWPRTAAFAERFWSDPDEEWRRAEMRIVHMRERMVQRGIAANTLQPEWCHQNEDKCKQ